MIRLNDNFQSLPKNYLFSEVTKKVQNFKQQNPDKELIRMDIGDVTLPLFPCVVEEINRAVEDLAFKATFKGYGPEQGYLFLRDSIAEYEYARHAIDISSDEIFISDGAKSDLGNLGNLFSVDCKVAVMNPSYPAYIDDNVMDGRAGSLKNGVYSNIIYIDCDPENNFMPNLPETVPDIIYLCFPNNPTGEGITKSELEKWVGYCLKNNSLIIYDAAYADYVRERHIVKSVYEIRDADKVAIEIRSFSKNAGFTGLRCGYTVVPKRLLGTYSNGVKESVHDLWNRRQTTKFNGASYISQKGATAIYTDDGRKAVRSATDYYLKNAGMLKEKLKDLGFECYGAINSPYVWVKSKVGKDSWEFFSLLLENCGITSTPGIGFGSKGSGYIRLTGFNSNENTLRAIEKLDLLNK